VIAGLGGALLGCAALTRPIALPLLLILPVAALVEPLACVVNGTRRAAARAGESVVIFGGGAIGCLFLAVFRLRLQPIVSWSRRTRAQVAADGRTRVAPETSGGPANGSWRRRRRGRAVGSQPAAIEVAAMGARHPLG
jgi:threonine dehydrogenase-like Zn-dependent dehydrogenase